MHNQYTVLSCTAVTLMFFIDTHTIMQTRQNTVFQIFTKDTPFLTGSLLWFHITSSHIVIYLLAYYTMLQWTALWRGPNIISIRTSIWTNKISVSEMHRGKVIYIYSSHGFLVKCELRYFVAFGRCSINTSVGFVACMAMSSGICLICNRNRI